MSPDAVIGNHYHRKTLIFFYLTSGLARITTIHVETEDKDDFLLRAGQGVILNTNESHASGFIEESSLSCSSRFGTILRILTPTTSL
jgi:quercetin dioxygenase-like cupin family protein